MQIGMLVGLAEAVLAFDLDMIEAVREIEAFDLGALGVGGAIGHQRELHAERLQLVDRLMRAGKDERLLLAIGGEAVGEARRLTVKGGFDALAARGHRALPDDLANRLADRFTVYREEEMFVFPGAHEAIDRLKALGVKLALVTNGAADTQRAKVERFELAHRFDHIQIEGEHGFGKPDEQAYLHAMAALGVTAPDTWMIGDNLEWEVEAPQRLGIYAIWMDVHGDGLPEGSTVKPDRIIRSLTELVPDRA